MYHWILFLFLTGDPQPQDWGGVFSTEAFCDEAGRAAVDGHQANHYECKLVPIGQP